MCAGGPKLLFLIRHATVLNGAKVHTYGRSELLGARSLVSKRAPPFRLFPCGWNVPTTCALPRYWRRRCVSIRETSGAVAIHLSSLSVVWRTLSAVTCFPAEKTKKNDASQLPRIQDMCRPQCSSKQNRADTYFSTSSPDMSVLPAAVPHVHRIPASQYLLQPQPQFPDLRMFSRFGPIIGNTQVQTPHPGAPPPAAPLLPWLLLTSSLVPLLLSPLLQPLLLSPRADQKAVERASTLWMNTLTLGTYDAPRKAAELYTPDGVLWGSEVYSADSPLWGTGDELIRNTPGQIYAYYVSGRCS